MSEQRNEYGFPLPLPKPSQQAIEMMIRYVLGDPSIILLPKDHTKLERAQAISAAVRARKFPPVQRITPKD